VPHADRLMQLPMAERGALAGMPIPIKDLKNVAGVRSTQGSPIFKDHIPEKSDVLVEHLEAAGGIVYAMSNTPEFGAGANTFNEVFGMTRNPWNTSRSAAGSSGGRCGGARDRHRVARATAPTWAGPCAIRRASTASSASGRASGGWRIRPRARST
jgi:hypothetical protein